MANQPQVVIVGLNEFRAALKAAQGTYPRQLTKALKLAGVPVIAKIAARVPYDSGTLAGSYRASVRGTRASITSRAPYGAGAEWGRYGKWSGFMRYGEPGRFAWRAVQESEEEIAAVMYAELKNVIEAYGWFHR